jgi:hypothetical protein
MRGSLKRELEMLKLILGPDNYKSLLLVTTKWGDEARMREFELRQTELEDQYWEDLIDGGAGVHRFEGTAESAKSIVAQLNDGADVILALQAQFAKRANVHLSETEVGKYAIRMRKRRKQELEDMSKKPGRQQKDLDDLRSRLDVGALDSQKLDVKIHETVKGYIAEAVKEEIKKNSRRPTPVNLISWTLSAIGSILGALTGTGML